jgi:hypothetical protein
MTTTHWLELCIAVRVLVARLEPAGDYCEVRYG